MVIRVVSLMITILVLVVAVRHRNFFFPFVKKGLNPFLVVLHIFDPRWCVSDAGALFPRR